MNLYRLSTTAMNFYAHGLLELVEGTYLLRLRVTPDEAFAVQADVRAERAVGILAIANGEAMLPAQSLKVKARADGPHTVELAMLLAS